MNADVLYTTPPSLTKSPFALRASMFITSLPFSLLLILFVNCTGPRPVPQISTKQATSSACLVGLPSFTQIASIYTIESPLFPFQRDKEGDRG